MHTNLIERTKLSVIEFLYTDVEQSEIKIKLFIIA